MNVVYCRFPLPFPIAYAISPFFFPIQTHGNFPVCVCVCVCARVHAYLTACLRCGRCCVCCVWWCTCVACCACVCGVVCPQAKGVVGAMAQSQDAQKEWCGLTEEPEFGQGRRACRYLPHNMLVRNRCAPHPAGFPAALPVCALNNYRAVS